MILALWIVIGLLAVAGMVIVAWPVGAVPEPVPARRSRPPGP